LHLKVPQFPLRNKQNVVWCWTAAACYAAVGASFWTEGGKFCIFSFERVARIRSGGLVSILGIDTGIVKPLKRIGIVIGGGDCPGLDSAVCGIAKPALTHFGVSVIGVLDGFEGLVEGKSREILAKEIVGMSSCGSMNLGTSQKGDPSNFPVDIPQGVDILDCSENAIRNYRAWNLDALIALGGDGTMHVIDKLSDLGLNCLGVPKTIDNDLCATDASFGCDSALAIATEAIDRLYAAASTRQRVVIVEVAGRYSGWVALGAGLSCGVDFILIPEIPFRWDNVCEQLSKRGKQGSGLVTICAAEGARLAEMESLAKEKGHVHADSGRFSGIGDLIGRKLAEMTRLDTRTIPLGHLQRSGRATAYDRLLASRFGVKVLHLASQEMYGQMVSLKGTEVVGVPVKEAILRLNTVPLDSQLVAAARAAGVSFGD